MIGRTLIPAIAIVAAAGFVLPVPTARAAMLVGPGGTVSFVKAEGGQRECRIKDLRIGESPVLGCGDFGTVWRATLPVPGTFRKIKTRAKPGANKVQAAFSNIGIALNVPQLGFPHYASAAVYNDFRIDDPYRTENAVDVQISVTYSWDGGIVGSLNYEGRILSTLEVEDITDPTNPVGVGGVELLARDRSGDQGFTDVALGGAAYDRNDETESLALKLHAGRTYRIWFKAEAYAAPLIATAVEASVRASWSELSVTVAEDQVGLLKKIKRLLDDDD